MEQKIWQESQSEKKVAVVSLQPYVYQGYLSISRTFDTKGEASAWAAKTEESIKAKKLNDPRLAMNVSFGQAVERYLETISCNKAITTHMREQASAARLMAQIG